MKRFLLAGLSWWGALAAAAAPFGSSFTFQGRLNGTNGLAQGQHDFEFGLWDRKAGGSHLGGLALSQVEVSNGLFTVDLDFGTNVFAGGAVRFVEVAVKRSADTNDPVVLLPRTRVAPAPYAVTAGDVPDGSIGTTKIALGAVDGNRLANGAVGFAQLGTWAVDLDKIADNAVTSNKLAPNSVQAFHIVTGAVGTVQLADDAVTTPKITNAAVTAAKIANGAVSNQHLAAGSVGAIHLLANSVNSAKIADGSIVAADIASGSITSNQLAPGTVDFAQLAKPYRSGVVTLSDRTNTFAPGPFSIPFSPAFASPPIVTFGVMPATNGGAASAELVDRATTSFTVRVRSEARLEFVASVVSNQFDEVSAGMVLDGADLVPACVYAVYEPGLFSTTPHGFVFARASDASGRSWTNGVVNTNAAKAALLADGSNTPVIAYTERLGASANKGLFAVRALLPNGIVWSSPANCDPSIGSVSQFDVAMVGGRPAILYTDVHSSSNVVQVKYVRANDAVGGSWGTPKLLASSTYSFGPDLFSPRLIMVSGAPAAYYDAFGTSIRTLRATDATGAVWGPTTNVASSLSSAALLDVAMIGGMPVALVHEYGATSYHYYRAKDATGTQWWPAYVVGHTAGDVEDAHLIDTEGRPGLSWSANGLHYAEAAYAQGSGWYPRVRIHDAVDADASRLFWMGNGLAQFVRSGDRRRIDYLWSGPAPAELQWTAVQP